MTRRRAFAALASAPFLSAAAAPRRDDPDARARARRQAEARRLARQHDALARALPAADPRDPAFYRGYPEVADWMRTVCRRAAGPRPSPAACAAAATGGSWR